MNVAVLMSTYNGEKYIEEQIDSILNQTGNFNLKLIVRDDGSTDKTCEILQKYSDEGRLDWYGGENLGVAMSFLNLLYTHPGYDFYAFSDQDDWWMPNKIEKSITWLQGESIPAIVQCNCIVTNEMLEPLNKDFRRKSPACDGYSTACSSEVQGCAMVINQALANMVTQKDYPMHLGLHDAFLAKVCTAVGGRIFYEKTPLFMYRQHGNNVVGVRQSVVNKIIACGKEILLPDRIGIAAQASEMLQLYGKNMTSEMIDWYKELSEYNANFKARLKLALSRKVKYRSRSWAVVMRMKILLGNR